MRPEYDFSGGVRGKHFEAYRRAPVVTVVEGLAGGGKMTRVVRKASSAKAGRRK